MPCLNEADCIAFCVDEAAEFLRRSGIDGEILIADNGSSDGSADIARAHGARVVSVTQRGYGSALTGGIADARGRFVLMGDCDGSYCFADLEPFLTVLRDGAELVVGNRYEGGFEKGSSPLARGR